MSHKNLIKLVIILAISTILNFLLYKLTPEYLPDFLWNNQKIVSCFIMLLIMVSIIYNVVTNNNIRIFSAQLLAWSGIFLAIIIAYAFRFELNYVTQRVVSVLVPSYNWTSKQGEMVISRNNDGHFYLYVIVNSATIKFMVDTGASDVALTTQDAKTLGFDLSKLNYTKTYSTANGASKAALVILDSVKIGDGVFRNIEAHIGTGGLDISLLGMSVLEKFRGFKIDRDMLILSY